MKGRPAAVEPEPREWTPGQWTPEMADEGFSLWTVRVGLDQVRSALGRASLHVLSCEQSEPDEPQPFVMWTGGGYKLEMDWLWGPIIHVRIAEKRMPDAIEAAVGYAHGWINQERARDARYVGRSA